MNYELQIISYLCTKFNDFMKKLTAYLSIIFIIIGTIVLITTRFHILASSNYLLLGGLLFIIAGIVMHIKSIKQDSKF